MRSSSRVAINTLAQYVRTIIVIIVSLWVSRAILGKLGVTDYGVYKIIGGVISLLAFVRQSITSTILRYLSFNIGRNDKKSLRLVFNNSVISIMLLSIGLCMMMLLLTPLVFHYFLNIPSERVEIGKFVYYMMVAGLFVTLMKVPYQSALVARENIVYASLVQIVDVLLKIPIAISLSLVKLDRLGLYTVLIFLLGVINFLLIFVYCYKKYGECRYFNIGQFQRGLFSQMLSFASWNMYGQMGNSVRLQGIALLLNNFFTVAINAAYGLAHQVVGHVATLSISLITAIRPQIIKAGGDGNYNQMFRLAEISCKFSFILMSMIAVPLILYIDTILSIWLKIVPPLASMFCISFIIVELINTATSSMVFINHAVGNIKKFNLWVNTIKFFSIPIVLLVLWIGAQPIYVMLVYILSEIVCGALRLIYIGMDNAYPVRNFVENVLLTGVPPVMVNSIICWILSCYFGGWRFIIVFASSIIITALFTLKLGLKEDERFAIKAMKQRVVNLIFIKNDK